MPPSPTGKGSADLSASEAGARPRIGLTTYLQGARWGVWDADAALLPADYVSGIEAAGGVPLLLPPIGTDAGIVDDLDGLVLTGGADVDPASYGADAEELTVVQPWRDAHELALARAALSRGLPLFAICRGLQVLNTALGGTLVQHLPAHGFAPNHQPTPGVYGEVEVETEPGSVVASIVGERARVSCYHHQGVDRPGEGLRVSARSTDGVIEALESASNGGPWLLAVQWHPEHNSEDGRLFAAFGEAAREYRARRLGAGGTDGTAVIAAAGSPSRASGVTGRHDNGASGVTGGESEGGRVSQESSVSQGGGA